MSTVAPRSSRTMLLLVSVGALLFVVSLGGLAWWLLPRWMPDWVVKHSPWITPAFRAAIHGQQHKAFTNRVGDWGDAVIEPMGEVLRTSADTEERLLAINSLFDITNPRIVPVLIIALDDPDPEHLEVVSFMLGKLQDPRAVEPLIAALLRHQQVIGLRLSSLAMDLDRIEHPRKFDLISASLLASPNERLQGGGCIALSTCSDPRVVPLLGERLGRYQQSSMEDDAGYALGHSSSPSTAGIIRAAMDDPDPRRRFGGLIAAQIALVVRPEQRDDWLLPLLALTRDPEAKVRTAAIISLAAFEDERARQRIDEAVHGSIEDALAAITCAQRLPDTRRTSVLIAALGHAAPTVRKQALMTLPIGAFSDARIVMLVRTCLHDPDADVVSAARFLATAWGLAPE